MDFEITQEESMIRSTAESVAAEYGPEYWREKEENGEFAQEFWNELAEAGFHGLLIPEKYDGAGMGMQEMGQAMETLCAEGCGITGTWYLVLTAGMASVGIRENGTEAQKERYLPEIAKGELNFSIGITFADRADYIILVTRTTPLDHTDRATDGISLFILDMEDPGISVSPIAKHGINYSNSCEVFIENVRVAEENLLGTEDEGWWALVDMLNPERIGFAAVGTGIGMLAADTAIEYTGEREVFGTPIGSHQAVSFSITRAYENMENCPNDARESRLAVRSG